MTLVVPFSKANAIEFYYVKEEMLRSRWLLDSQTNNENYGGRFDRLYTQVQSEIAIVLR